MRPNMRISVIYYHQGIFDIFERWIDTILSLPQAQNRLDAVSLVDHKAEGLK